MSGPRGSRAKRGGKSSQSTVRQARVRTPSERFDRGGDLSAGRLFENLKRDVEALVAKGVNNPFKSVSDLVAFFASVCSVLGFFGATSASVGGTLQTPVFLSVFPTRVMAFAMIAASIGWTLSTFGIWTTSNQSPWSRIMGHFVNVLGAFFLAACIDWIFAPDLYHAPLLVLFFVVCGVALSVFLGKTNYRLTLEPDASVVSTRAEFLATFAFSAAALVILRQVAQV